MFKIKNLFAITLIVTAFIFIGCQNTESPVDPFLDSNPVELSKASIPYGATIDSAAFFINVTSGSEDEVTLHRVTNDWQESMVTWNNFAAGFNADVEASFTPTLSDWIHVDITSLVTNWFDETYPNYGILLKETSPGQFQSYNSRESGTSPYLKVFWTKDGISGYDSTGAFADTYIRSDSGDINYGSKVQLATGWEDTVERQTLITFEIEKVYTGCTRSAGYWKTHSIYGPAPYDSTWALLGEDSTFFLSNKTYYQVEWTPPKKGNAYYILSFAYIGTALNLLAGADPFEVQDVFDEATELFETYTPEYIEGLKGNNPIRQHFLELKSTLEQYNSGMIGPGMCDKNGYNPLTDR